MKSEVMVQGEQGSVSLIQRMGSTVLDSVAALSVSFLVPNKSEQYSESGPQASESAFQQRLGGSVVEWAKGRLGLTTL